MSSKLKKQEYEGPATKVKAMRLVEAEPKKVGVNPTVAMELSKLKKQNEQYQAWIAQNTFAIKTLVKMECERIGETYKADATLSDDCSVITIPQPPVKVMD